MTLPLKNSVFDKIKEHGSLTDSELSKALIKDGFVIAEDRFNKLLLDLEIIGRIKVTWLTKDTRRIEVIIEKVEVDEIEAQNKAMMEKDYEASFPGAENE
jgi:nitrogen-specific signal transduction histidine kinase